MDTLASLLSKILNAERIGKRFCSARPSSVMIRKVLEIMKTNGYIANYEIVDDKKGCFVNVELAGKINNCGVIKPRFSVKVGGYEKFEKRFLPAKGFGYLIISTNKGVMTHVAAQENKLGGKLISYFY